MILLSEAARSLLLVFLIIFLGYLLGRIRIGGVGLGNAGIFLVGLIFGHLGAELPGLVQNVGLVLFITSVGFSAGPGFTARFRRNGLRYVLLCLTTALAGCAVCLFTVRVLKIEAPLAVGIMTGAFTTSPGFAAAKEAAGDSAALVAAGYGLVYPVGVVCKVLFIQLVPKLLHADMAKERALIAPPPEKKTGEVKPRIALDSAGFSCLALAAVLGVVLGSVTIPLPGVSGFRLGNTGGPLLVALLLGALGRIGPVSLQVSGDVTKSLKELGVILFFVGAGVEGGHGVAAILAQYGAIPLVLGAAFVLLPLICGFLMLRWVLKLPLLDGLGSLTASMTSTPALSVLAELAGTDDVAAAYATTYPVALVTLVTLVQFLIRQ